MIRERLCLSIINILFPPAAVYYVAGLGADVLLNCIFFCLGVLPAHVHSFYLTWTYGNRKRKVRAGRWPGPPRGLVYSDKVNNGGASGREVRVLKERWERGEEGEEGFLSRVGSRISGTGSAGGSRSASVNRGANRERSTERSRSRTTEGRRSRRVERLDKAGSGWDEGYASMETSPVSPTVSNTSSRRSRAMARKSGGYDGFPVPAARSGSQRRIAGSDHGYDVQPVRSRQSGSRMVY